MLHKKISDKQVCFFCLDPDHLISNCRIWKQKVAASRPKSTALVNTLGDVGNYTTATCGYQPFLLDGTVSHSPDSEGKSVKILRDTGSVQLFIREELLPSLSNYSGADILIRGIGMQCLRLLLHDLYFKSDLVTGPVRLGDTSCLPVEGVDVILGNYLAGGNVFPRPVVISELNARDCSRLVQCFPTDFPACAVRHTQAEKLRDVVDPSETLLDNSSDHDLTSEKADVKENGKVETVPKLNPVLGVRRKQLVAAQKTHPLFPRCIESTVDLKTKCYKKSVSHGFQPKDVLVFFTEPGSALLAKFAGPCQVKEKLSDTDHVISTPDR